MTVRLPAPCLVVLIGPSGAGKSYWAGENFRPEQVVASDELRALVGEGRYDQRAGTDAFAILDEVVERRLRRRLLTVVDTLGLEPKRRAALVAQARRHGVPCHAVMFTTDAATCRTRNAGRERPVPAKVLAAQFKTMAAAVDAVVNDGFDGIHHADEVVVVPSQFLTAPSAAGRQEADPMPLQFGLQLSRFTWEGDAAERAAQLRDVTRVAEDVGFTSLWVMDHFIQIPPVGREWEEMPESYATLCYLAGVTERATLGTLVTGVTYRNLAHLGKIVATLDVLSGGRAVCGLGAAWFDTEHRAYGFRFPPKAERFAMLEDALQLLPLMWGPGAPPFSGRTTEVAQAICYPRPIQERIPILVGGGGERRTLRLVAQYADACNLFGDADTVRHKVSVLRKHCADVGRDPADVTVTHLGSALAARDPADVDRRVSLLRPAMSPEAGAADLNAATVGDHIGRFRGLAEAGVQTAIVALPDLDGTPEAVERFAPVIDAFRG